MNKKGIEVSINFIVILIISIVVLGFAITIFTGLFQKSDDFTAAVSESNRARLDSMLDSGEPVVVLRNVRTINIGEDDLFQLAVSNEQDEEAEFKTEISTPTGDAPRVIYNEDTYTLSPKERRYIPFKVEVPGGVQKGSYIFQVSIKKDGEEYFHPVNVYINVP